MFTIEHAMIVKDSGKALLVEAPTLRDEGHWIPQSCVHEDSEIWKEGEVGTIGIVEWWAEKEGLL